MYKPLSADIPKMLVANINKALIIPAPINAGKIGVKIPVTNSIT